MRAERSETLISELMTNQKSAVPIGGVDQYRIEPETREVSTIEQIESHRPR